MRPDYIYNNKCISCYLFQPQFDLDMYLVLVICIAKSNKFDNILVHVPDKSFFATLDDKDVHKFHHKYGQSQPFWHDIDFILTLNKQKALNHVDEFIIILIFLIELVILKTFDRISYPKNLG